MLGIDLPLLDEEELLTQLRSVDSAAVIAFLEERKEARLLPLDEIREQLREHIYEEKMEAAVKQENERLKSEAEIQVLIPLEDRGAY